MSIGKAIFARLSSTTAITDLVEDRVFPEAVYSDEPVPQVVYSVTESNPDRTYSGASGLVNATVEVWGIASTYESSTALASAVREAVDNEKGTWGGIVVQGSFVRSQSDEHSSIPDMGEDLYFITTLTLNVWYES